MSNAVRNVAPIRGPLKQKKYSIIIPAAGEGARMSTYGPKCLLNLDGKNRVIDRQIKLLKDAFRHCEIILVSGFQSDKVMAHVPADIVKVENENYADTNVVRSIGMGLRVATTDRILIVYGDLVFNKQALFLPANKDSFLVYDNAKTMKDEEVGCTFGDGCVQQVFYELSNKWAQIAYFTGKELELLKNISWKRENALMFGFEAINQIIDRGGHFGFYSPKDMKITDIDCSKDIARARSIL